MNKKEDNSSYLILLYRLLDTFYDYYKAGYISEKEYLVYIKPIDKLIDRLEYATLQDTLVLKKSF